MNNHNHKHPAGDSVVYAAINIFSKSQLVQHYIDNLGAMHVGGRIMIIDTKAALKLINKYFSNEK